MLRRLMRERGSAALCVDTPEVYRQRSGWIVLPEEQDYWEASRPLREAFQKVEVPTATRSIGKAPLCADNALATNLPGIGEEGVES